MLAEYVDLLSEALDYLESTPATTSAASKGAFEQFGRWCKWVKRVQDVQGGTSYQSESSLSLVRPSVLVNDAREFPDAWVAGTRRLAVTISELHTPDTYMHNFFVATSESTPSVWEDAANIWKIDPNKMWVSPYMTQDASFMRTLAVIPTLYETNRMQQRGPYETSSKFAMDFDALTVYKTSRSADINPTMRHFLGPLIPIGFTARRVNPMNHTPPLRINSPPVFGNSSVNTSMAGLEEQRLRVAHTIWRDLLLANVEAHLMSRGTGYGAITRSLTQEFLKRAVQRVAAITMETYLHDIFAMKLGVNRQPHLLLS